MKVKVKNKIYDSENEPVMVILNKQDKINIRDMPKDNTHYCGYPDKGYTAKEIEKWMADDAT